VSKTFRTRPQDANGDRYVRVGDRYVRVTRDGRRSMVTRTW